MRILLQNMTIADASKIVPIGFIVMALGWRYVSVPLQFRKSLWFAERLFERVSDEAFPLEIEQRVTDPSEELATMGFRAVGLFLMTKPRGRIESVYLLVLVNHQTADIVYISTLLARAGSGPHRGRASFMFFRPFVDRTCIATGNGVSKSIFRRSQDAGPLMLSDLSDLQKLYSVHVARCHRYQGGRVAVVPDEVDIDAEFQRAVTEDREDQMLKGYLERTESPVGYQPTLKGAFVWGWQELWPLKNLNRFAERRRVDRELKLLGFGGVKRFYQSESMEVLPLGTAME